MSRSKMVLVIAGLAFLAGFATTAPGEAADRFDHVVREKFFAGFTGNTAALDEAMKICEEVLAAKPDHAEALVWHGSGLFQRAGQAFQTGDTRSGQETMTRALAEMDRAVQIAPDHVGVRVPRGAVLLAASRFMPPQHGKPLLDRGLSDYEHVLAMQTSYFDTLGTHPRGELLFGLAEGWARAEDPDKAATYFQRIVNELPDTAYAKRAAKWLQSKTLAAAETGCIGCHVSSNP